MRRVALARGRCWENNCFLGRQLKEAGYLTVRLLVCVAECSKQQVNFTDNQECVAEDRMIPTRSKFLCTCLVIIFFLGIIEARKRKYSKRKDLQSRETSLFDFVRLLVLRLVYGFASAMGFGESISQFLGGIFVPPGVEDDYSDFDY